MLLLAAVSMSLAGCSQAPSSVSGPDSGHAPGHAINETRSAEAVVPVTSLADGIELNATGPTALRIALNVPGEQDCDLTLAVEYVAAGHGLSYMVIHQRDGGRGTGQGMSTQDTAVDAGPIDNRDRTSGEPASSRLSWSVSGGEITIDIAILYAQPHASDFVANGSVLLRSDCDGVATRLTHAGDQVAMWHAQTLNGTALVSHAGGGLLIDRGIKAEFSAAVATLAAFHAGDAVGVLSFRGPALDHQAILPTERLITSNGGPGTYQTTVSAAGGARIWGFMAGLDVVDSSQT